MLLEIITPICEIKKYYVLKLWKYRNKTKKLTNIQIFIFNTLHIELNYLTILWIRKAHHISLFAKYSGLHFCCCLKIPMAIANFRRLLGFIIFLLATVSAVETATASAVGAVACYFNFVKRTVFTIWVMLATCYVA